MIRRCLPKLTALVALLLLAACGGGADRARLDRAEALMDERPDSALAILDSVDGSRLRGADRALYALLLTQARDKNYIDLAGDTLIREAVDFYNGKGDDGRLALAYYYRGRVNYDSHNYQTAIVDFTRTKEMADCMEDPFLAGLACRGIGDIYCLLLSPEDELEFARKGYDYMRRSGKTPYELDALYDLGRAYYNTRRLPEAEKTVACLRERACGDSSVLINADHLEALCLSDRKRYAEALPLWDGLMSSPYVTTLDSLRRCEALLGAGKIKEGELFLTDIQDDGNPMRALLTLEISQLKGDESASLRSLYEFDSGIQALLVESRSNKLSSELTEYFELNSRLHQSELRASRLGNVLSWCLSALIVIGAISILYILYRRHQERLREKQAQLEEVIKLSEDLERRYRLLELVHGESTAAGEQVEAHLQEVKERLYQSEIQLRKTEESLGNSENEIKGYVAREALLMPYLNEITEQRLTLLRRIRNILDSYDKKDKRSLQMHEIKVLLERLRPYLKDLEIKKEELVKLEACLNLNYKGAMENFRQEVKLKEADYSIFMLSILDQPCDFIAALLGYPNTSSVYVRRKQIQISIKAQVPEETADKYIGWMRHSIYAKKGSKSAILPTRKTS